MEVAKRKIKFPLFFLIGVLLIILAWILGGTQLLIDTGWRFFFGILAGIGVLIVIAILKKRKKGGAKKVGK